MLDKQDQVKSMLHRIKISGDGIDLVEYLTDLTSQNYKSWVRSDTTLNEFHKGYAFAIDSLLESFEQCDKKVEPEQVIGDFT